MQSKSLKSKFGIVARTSVGKLRKNNEDFHGYSTNIIEKDWHFYEESIVSVKNVSLLVVADGMGGLEMGEEASRIAVETTKQYFFDNAEEIINNIPMLNQKMDLLFTQINKEILSFAKQSNNEGKTGTTLIFALIVKKKAYIFWIGDSRAYLFRKAALKPLTKDHSYVQELVDKGKLTYEQSFHHPDSNIITKYMGDPQNNPKPSFVEVDLEKGDILMLCTDGLNGMLEDKDIEGVFFESDDLTNICEKLIENANEAGGNDNNTIILAAFDDFAKYVPEKRVNGTQTLQTPSKNKRGLLKITIAVLIGLLFGIVIMYFAKDIIIKENDEGVITADTAEIYSETVDELQAETYSDSIEYEEQECIQESLNQDQVPIENQQINKTELPDTIKNDLHNLIKRLERIENKSELDSIIIIKSKNILEIDMAEKRYFINKLQELSIELEKKEDILFSNTRKRILKLIENL